MPKLSKDFPAQLSLQVTEEMKIALVTLGYLEGDGGEYARVARNLLHNAIQARLLNMRPEERREYDEILANVKIMVTKKLPQEKQNAPA